jgi:hypothetical protein
MKENRFKRARAIAAIARTILPIAFLVTLLLASPWRARASDPYLDGGGFPTRTPTRRVRNPLPRTAQAVQPSATLFPASSTPTGGAAVLGQGEQQPLAPNIGTTSQTAQPFSLLSCWPFALVILLVLIVGVMWISNRIRQNTV